MISHRREILRSFPDNENDNIICQNTILLFLSIRKRQYYLSEYENDNIICQNTKTTILFVRIRKRQYYLSEYENDNIICQNTKTTILFVRIYSAYRGSFTHQIKDLEITWSLHPCISNVNIQFGKRSNKQISKSR